MNHSYTNNVYVDGEMLGKKINAIALSAMTN